jgi:hypothetical protein
MDIHVVLNLFHIVLVAPFFLWIGASRASLPDQAFTVCFMLGLFVTIYHAYKAYIRLSTMSIFVWVNVLHFLWVGPLLMFIGANKKETPRPAFELMLITGFAALGYHLYELAIHNDFM